MPNVRVLSPTAGLPDNRTPIVRITDFVALMVVPILASMDPRKVSTISKIVNKQLTLEKKINLYPFPEVQKLVIEK